MHFDWFSYFPSVKKIHLWNLQCQIQEFMFKGALCIGEGSGDHLGPQQVQGSTQWGALGGWFHQIGSNSLLVNNSLPS